MKIHFITRLLAFTLLVICAISCKKKALDDTTLLSQHWNVTSCKINGAEQLGLNILDTTSYFTYASGYTVYYTQWKMIKSITADFLHSGTFNWNVTQVVGSATTYPANSGTWKFENNDKQVEVDLSNGWNKETLIFNIIELKEDKVKLSGSNITQGITIDWVLEK